MKPQYSDRALLQRIARETRAYWPHVFGIFLLSLLSAPIALLAPMPLKMIIDNLIGGRPLPGWILAIAPGAARSPGMLLVCATALIILVTLLTYLQGSGTWLLQTYAGEGMRNPAIKMPSALSVA